MNNQEAKFRLGAYRPNGSDASDPAFTEALAQAERDPALKAWFERERALDASCAAKLRDIAPPAGLREAILAGARASRPHPRWWQKSAWLAAAATLAVLLAVALSMRTGRGEGRTMSEFAAFALNDIIEAHNDHQARPVGLDSIQAQLGDVRLPMPTHLDVDVSELRRKGCRTVRLAGRDVFEVCFNRDGTWYHLYVGRAGEFAAREERMIVSSRGEYSAAAWSDSKAVYALVAQTSAETLRRVL